MLHQGFTPPDTCKSFSHLIPILKIYFWNNDASKDFVNKSTRLSHDFVCHFSVTREDRIV